MAEDTPEWIVEKRPAETSSGVAWRLGVLLGAIYFYQGLCGPDEGLLAQPVRSLLRSWGRDASEIATFSALLAIPWSLKPLYGLVADLVPMGRSRRRNYLMLMSGLTAFSLVWLSIEPVSEGSAGRLLLRLILPAIALPFADVVTDAIMVERGRPLGLTGRLQAIQWACLGLAAMLAGIVGGRLSERHLESRAFLISGLGAASTFVLAWACLRQPDRSGPPEVPRRALAILRDAIRVPALPGIVAFLVLWNFNPFSYDVLYIHVTRELGWGDRFFGEMAALRSAAEVAACVAYGILCRRISMRVLTHAAIALGVLSTLGYLLMVDRRVAVLVALAVGFAYMMSTLILLDLAARVCPPEVAGTTFAILMSVQNLSTSLSISLGGYWYELGVDRWGAPASFRTLVLVGSAFTAGCWLLLPLISASGLQRGPRAITPP